MVAIVITICYSGNNNFIFLGTYFMQMIKIIFLFFVLVMVNNSALFAQDSPASKRSFYEYKGNYGEQLDKKKSAFTNAFGYELVDMGRSWAPDEVEILQLAFKQLPSTFYGISGVKSLYRLDSIVLDSEQIPTDDIPAATLPAFSTIYEHTTKSYKVFVDRKNLRVEFYNPLFYEDRSALINIIQHEMAHAFDMAKGFLSFSDEWISLTKFRVLHIFALDGDRDSNSIYTLLNDPAVDNYAPVSIRNLPTYSRLNPQEDFANSVTAYIHYPYFRYTHPSRYEFLKKNVFAGKEYFLEDSTVNSFEEKIQSDLDNALANGQWDDVRNIFIELGRGYYPGLEKRIISQIKETLGTMSVSREKDRILALGTCYLNQPEGLELRKDLIRAGRVSVKTFLKDQKCFRIARDFFEKNLSKWSASNLYFYQDGGKSFLQFTDPVLPTAHVRGFDTEYSWRMFVVDGGKKPIAQGRFITDEGGNGSVLIDLMQSAGKKFDIPEGKTLGMDLGIRRTHPRTFKIIESKKTGIQFIVRPWFRYMGPQSPEIRLTTPFNSPRAFH